MERRIQMSENKDFLIQNGVLEEYNGAGADVVIPEGPTEIGFGAFGYKDQIKTVTIAGSVKKIDMWAFQGCIGLTEVTIPETVQEMEGGVFYGCRNIELIRMPLRLLEVNLFSPTSKMVKIELTEKGEVIATVPVIFRKDYPSSPTWIHCEDYIAPIGSDNIAYFDKVLAAGTYDGFNTNEDGRIKAILWRLNNRKEPIAPENISAIRDFISSKLTKTLKYVVGENVLESIRSLIDIGVITEENEKKVSKILAKSEDETVRSIASALADFVSETPSAQICDKEQFPLEEKFKQEYIKSQAGAKIIRFGIEIPELKAANGNGTVPKEYLELFISMYMDKTAIIPIADEAAEMIDRKCLNDVLLMNYEKQATKKNKLALINAVMRFADEDTVRMIYRTLTDNYNQNSVLSAILLNDSNAAMMIVDKNKRLQEYALIRCTDEDTIRDQFLSNIGLDETGGKTYDLGNQTVTARLQKDLSFLVELPTGKTAKSLPKKEADAEKYAAANADFSEMKKSAKKIVKNRVSILFEDFLSGRARKADAWKEIYLKNPLLRQVASLLVWVQDGKTFLLTDTGAMTADGTPYSIGDAEIVLAHPMEMSQNDLIAWQKYFSSNGIKQSFEQIWEPVVDENSVKGDRYQGCMIPYYRFLGQNKHGIYVEDKDFHNDIDISFDDCHADIDRIDWMRHEISPDHRFEIRSFCVKQFTRKANHIIAYLDRVTIYDRIRKDDTGISTSLPQFTLAQITEFLKVATENNCTNVTALLLDYKNQNFADFEPMDEFSLEW